MAWRLERESVIHGGANVRSSKPSLLLLLLLSLGASTYAIPGLRRRTGGRQLAHQAERKLEEKTYVWYEQAFIWHTSTRRE